MRLYDHIVLVEAGAGDLHKGPVGVFGAIPGRTQLFARRSADLTVTNRFAGTVLEQERVISRISVHSYFATNMPDHAATSEELDKLLVRGLRFVVDVTGLDDVICHYPMRHALVHGGSPQVTIVDPAANEAVQVPAGAEWWVVAVMDEALLMQLNGAVRKGNRWIPGDPKMTRIVRVFLDHEEVK